MRMNVPMLGHDFFRVVGHSERYVWLPGTSESLKEHLFVITCTALLTLSTPAKNILSK